MSKSLDELTALDTVNDSNLLYVVSEGGDRKTTKANLVSGLAKDTDIPTEGDFDISNLADAQAKKTAWDSKLDNITGQDLSTADNTVSGFISDIAGEDLSTADNTTAGFLSSIPTASATTLGGVKVGTNLTITDGVLSADEQGGGGSAVASEYATVVDVNGTGDYTTLSAALTAGATEIFIKAGTYNEGAISTTLDNVTIHGENREKTVIGFSTGDFLINADNWEIENLTFSLTDTGKFRPYGSDIKLKYLNIIQSGVVGSTQRAVEASGGKGIEIDKCFFDIQSAEGTGIFWVNRKVL